MRCPNSNDSPLVVMAGVYGVQVPAERERERVRAVSDLIQGDNTYYQHAARER